MERETRQRRSNQIVVIALVILLILVVVVLFAVGSQGLLPWQPEPTRIPITPFADLPGGGTSSTPVP